MVTIFEIVTIFFAFLHPQILMWIHPYNSQIINA